MNNAWSAKIHDTVNRTETLTVELRYLTDEELGDQLKEDHSEEDIG